MALDVPRFAHGWQGAKCRLARRSARRYILAEAIIARAVLSLTAEMGFHAAFLSPGNYAYEEFGRLSDRACRSTWCCRRWKRCSGPGTDLLAMDGADGAARRAQSPPPASSRTISATTPARSPACSTRLEERGLSRAPRSETDRRVVTLEPDAARPRPGGSSGAAGGGFLERICWPDFSHAEINTLISLLTRLVIATEGRRDECDQRWRKLQEYSAHLRAIAKIVTRRARTCIHEKAARPFVRPAAVGLCVAAPTTTPQASEIAAAEPGSFRRSRAAFPGRMVESLQRSAGRPPGGAGAGRQSHLAGGAGPHPRRPGATVRRTEPTICRK